MDNISPSTSSSRDRQRTSTSSRISCPTSRTPQNLHIKVPQQDYIKLLIEDNLITNHNISLDHAMPVISDTDSTSSGLITLDEANIMSTDINMLAVSQPRLPTPTPFDGTSPPFKEWASELRTFLNINGFQYIQQMDVAFREDAPLHLSHLCAGTEIGTTSQDGITEDKAAIKLLQDELADPGHLRTDDDINNEIGVLGSRHHCSSGQL